MEVTCPNCASRFNLPDGVGKPGAKLRCSVCKEIFRLPSLESASPAEGGFNLDGPLSMPEPPKSRFKRVLALLLVLLVAAGGGGWWYYTSGKNLKPAESTVVPLAEKVKLLTMRNVRQYFVENEKIGRVFVIEGTVVNEFPVPKELIEMEAALYDQGQKPLASKRQLAGTVLSHFQLQVLSEKELESSLNNKIDILTNNTNVPPGGEVPFMVLFYAPPDNIGEFGIKIVDVRDVEKK